MTATVSLLPPMTGTSVPPPNPRGLSDDERRIIAGLANRLTMQAMYAREHYLYYDGDQAIENLGISVPDVLAGVRTVVDWPRICVDRLTERSSEIDGFRLPGKTEVDDELRAHWVANDLDAEFPLVQQDSLVTRCGYMIAGSPDEPGGSPVVTVESPLNLALGWDPRTRSVRYAYQAFEVEGVFCAALYLPDETIHMSQENGGMWTVDRRDRHKFGEVPVVRFPNRARTSDREGRSQITRAVKTTTNAALRALLGMDIAREVYSVPHLAILGATEASFIGADGTQKRALDMAMTQVLAFERDEEGDLPQLVQLKAFDPSVFTKIIDEHAQLMSSYTGFPPHYFGQTTTANPASADAIRVSLDGVDRGGRRVQLQSTASLRKVGQLMWRFANKGQPLPKDLKQLEVDWIDASTPTPAGTNDALAKQITTGMVPATSDVVRRRAGYTVVERKRLEQDTDLAQQLEAELTTSLAARQARTGNAVANDLEAARQPQTPATPQ